MAGSHLEVGDVGPAFELLDQQGRTVRLSDFGGRTVLLYFYPVAFSEDCTEQGCSVRDHRSGLADLGVDVLAISPDPVETQRDFSQRYSLGFPLLSDPDHAVAERYGVWTDYEYAGSVVTGVLRSSFLLDAHGIITHVWSPVLAIDTAPNAIEAFAGRHRANEGPAARVEPPSVA